MQGTQTLLLHALSTKKTRLLIWIKRMVENQMQASKGVLWKGVFKNFAWGLQLYEKRDSGTGVFLWLLWNFLEHIFYRFL